jgi:NADH:ubiquinone reductase (H+-translocating)
MAAAFAGATVSFAEEAMNPNRGARPRVVIVGGGFGGLEAAKGLARTSAEVVLVDAKNHHCFQPLLYQVATAALSPTDIAWPIRYIMRGQENLTVLMQEVRSIDMARRVVLTGDGEIAFDWLVIATGAAHSYFGHEAWAESAPGLKTIDDAIRIRRRILLAFEQAEAAADPAERERLLTFIIVGGGPTGVELAGDVAELARRALPPDFHRSDPKRARILLLEAGPRLLADFPERLSDYARRELERMQVTVRTETAVEAVNERSVSANGQKIAAGTILWAAGVHASPAAAWLGAKADRNGRVLVEPDLSAPSLPFVFVVGDVAAVAGSDGQLVPGLAPAAKQMGRYVAQVIRSRLDGKIVSAPFRYRNMGSLATIGRSSAIVKLGRLELTGYAGWLFWCFAHIYLLISLRSRIFVSLSWAFSYLTFQRGARLITRG